MPTFIELGEKEIVNRDTGARLGYVDDVEYDPTTMKVTGLIIFGRQKLLGLAGREDDLVVPLEEVETVGSDIILVRGEPQRRVRKN